MIDEPITTVERDCQHKEARAEAEIARTRVVPSSQRILRWKNVAVAVSEIVHLRNARIVLNVGVQIISNEFARIYTRTS